MSASTYSARSPDDYFETRVDFKTEAYSRKGDHYRWGYLATASVAAMAAAAVPVLINLKDVPSIVPTLLSLLVTILVTLKGIFHFREHWKNLDSATFASELLRSKPLLHMIVRFEESATQEFREDGVCGANGEKYGQAGAQCVGDDKFGGREFGAHGA